MSLTYSITPSKENIVAYISLYNPVTVINKIPANIDVGLEKPILRKCSDYKLTILRFQCPLTSVKPLFDVTGQVFKMAMRYGTGAATIATFVGGTEPITSINDFTNVILAELIKNSYPGGIGAFNKPYFYYQAESRLFYLVLTLTDSSNNLQIIIHDTLRKYLVGFPALEIPNFFGPGQTGYPLRIHEQVANDEGYNYISPRIANPCIRIVSEYPTDYRFNQLQSVIITSNIPVRMETIPLSTQQAVANPNNSFSYIATLPILTDFRPDVSQYGLQNSSLIYFPTAEYKWIDLMSDGPLDRLSFNFLWQSTDQNIHQLYLSPGESVSLKLYFRSLY